MYTYEGVGLIAERGRARLLVRFSTVPLRLSLRCHNCDDRHCPFSIRTVHKLARSTTTLAIVEHMAWVICTPQQLSTARYQQQRRLMYTDEGVGLIAERGRARLRVRFSTVPLRLSLRCHNCDDRHCPFSIRTVHKLARSTTTLAIVEHMAWVICTQQPDINNREGSCTQMRV